MGTLMFEIQITVWRMARVFFPFCFFGIHNWKWGAICLLNNFSEELFVVKIPHAFFSFQKKIKKRKTFCDLLSVTLSPSFSLSLSLNRDNQPFKTKHKKPEAPNVMLDAHSVSVMRLCEAWDFTKDTSWDEMRWDEREERKGLRFQVWEKENEESQLLQRFTPDSSSVKLSREREREKKETTLRGKKMCERNKKRGRKREKERK